MQVGVSERADHCHIPRERFTALPWSQYEAVRSRLPSSLVRPTGSLVTGMPAEVTARAMTSLIASCLVVLLGAAYKLSHATPVHLLQHHIYKCGQYRRYSLLLVRIAVLRPILTDREAWSVGLSVGLSVCHTSELCKNGCTDRAAV